MTKQHLASAEADTNTLALRQPLAAAPALLAVMVASPTPALAEFIVRLTEHLHALNWDADVTPDHDGEADQDEEANVADDGPWWTLAMGPADCGPVRLASMS